MRKNNIHGDILLENSKFEVYIYISYTTKYCCWGNGFSDGTSYITDLQSFDWNFIDKLSPVKNEEKIREQFSSFIEESRRFTLIDLLEDRL